MDRLLLHQIISLLSKSVDSPPDIERIGLLFDRLLIVAKDAAYLGQVLWFSTRQANCHPIAVSVLNRLVKCSTKWNIASVVNYAYTWECLTPLHLASGFTNLPLIELLLQLGAEVWRPSTNGQVAMHFAIKQLKNNSSMEVIQMLCRKMVFTDDTLPERFRKNGIVPAAIEANQSAILNMISHCGIKFEYRLYLEYFDYALQTMANEEVTGHLLEQLRSCSLGLADGTSPVDLSLQYSNMRAMLQAITLGFNCSSNVYENGFLLLRRTFISERHTDLFPTASRCFHYLMRQLVKSCEDLTGCKPLQRLHQFLSHLVSSKVCHRVNGPEVVINGNYLTFALLNHCGSMARYLVELPLAVQFPVEKHLLRFYRFSRHDGPALKCLVRQERLRSPVDTATVASFMQQNCPPLYDPTVQSSNSPNDDLAAREYAQDRIEFQRFIEWLDYYRTQPKSLARLARNAIFNGFWKLGSATECCSADQPPSLQEMSVIARRFDYQRQLLGKTLFDHTFCSSVP